MAQEKSVQPDKNSGGELEVKIQTPEEVIWEGRAEAVSSQNRAGLFDILPEHANIITLIENRPIEVVTASGSHTYNFEKAVIFAQDNKVSIYADILIRSISEAKQAQHH